MLSVLWCDEESSSLCLQFDCWAQLFPSCLASGQADKKTPCSFLWFQQEMQRTQTIICKQASSCRLYCLNITKTTSQSFSCSSKTFQTPLGVLVLFLKYLLVWVINFVKPLGVRGTMSIYIWTQFWVALTDGRPLECLSRCRHYQTYILQKNHSFSLCKIHRGRQRIQQENCSKLLQLSRPNASHTFFTLGDTHRN